MYEEQHQIMSTGGNVPSQAQKMMDAARGSMHEYAVSMLAANLRGGDAGTMAGFLQLALQAVETNGYGITYAVGPMGEFGLLVVPLDSDGKAEINGDTGDYALLTEIGTAEMLRETVQAANQGQTRNVPECEECQERRLAE